MASKKKTSPSPTTQTLFNGLEASPVAVGEKAPHRTLQEIASVRQWLKDRKAL